MKQLKLLIVKSEKKIADALRQGLEESQYTVGVAYKPGPALKSFTTDHYDLVIIDINLANNNAYDLCKQFKQLHADTPIIFLTPYTDPADRLEGFHAGADDYIIKPFEFKELLFKINIFFKKNATNSNGHINFLKAGDLELHTETKTVIRNKKSIQLTSKEFQLLEYLLKNKNRIISRSELARHVWEIDFDTNTNFVDVYINYLRNKVDKNFDRKLIHTQVGMGYVLKEH